MKTRVLFCLLFCAVFVFGSVDVCAEIYVVGRDSDNIVVFDDAGAHQTSVALPSGSGEAADIARAPNGEFFVLRSAGSVHRFDAGLNFIETWSSFPSAYGINVDESGLVYVAGSGSSSVSVYDVGGTLQTTLTPDGGSNLRDTVRVGGNTWVSNFEGDKIDIIDGTGSDIGDVTAPDNPFGMQLAPNGDVWVVAQDTHVVERITPGGSVAFSFDADDGPNGSISDQLRYIGVGADGAVYIPHRGDTFVDVYDDSGVYLVSLADPSLDGPDGICATGSLVVEDRRGIPALGTWGVLLLIGMTAALGWWVLFRGR